MITRDDLKDLIDRIKRATGKTQRKISEGAGYKPDSLSELLAQKNGNCEPAYKQLQIVYSEALKNSISAKDFDHIDKVQRFTADQLFHMYMKAMERQDKLMATQTAILESIENKMAREQTLADVKTNLDATLLGVRSLELKLSTGREIILESLSRLEKRPERELLEEADSLMLALLRIEHERQKGIKEHAGKASKRVP